MKSPSVSTHRILVHWQGFLLVVSILTFWSLPTIAQLGIVSTCCTKGEDVVLRIRNKPPEAIAYVWYKGKGMDKNSVIAFFIKTLSFHLSGPENNGEKMITNDGSLLLKKVIMMDSGIYTVVAHFPDSKPEIGFGQLDVYEHLRVPMLIASSYGVRENEDDVDLTCYTNGLSVKWLFNGTDLKFTDRVKLKADGRRITLNPLKREDTGDYKCKASKAITSVESPPLELHVLY
ncbi:carcinoembryonic antigen-related cell adhesion molecule 21-like [Phyllostomus discolor]|uniref:Carcinoembryonic antigen-related cell adhesion molecule 21-like n=1 Tax=Phyllostomus discolor TaxID=89673 RepID=A0A7E6CP01_9CHIR|nr:carcinoembryonic antigen-related cell adhesion molecule 21-like [Phyllostomus discolor]